MVCRIQVFFRLFEFFLRKKRMETVLKHQDNRTNQTFKLKYTPWSSYIIRKSGILKLHEMVSINAYFPKICIYIYYSFKFLLLCMSEGLQITIQKFENNYTQLIIIEFHWQYTFSWSRMSIKSLIFSPIQLVEREN